MEMHQVRYFLSVARTLNFTQAAQECHVAQPSLSRAILKLEEEFGGDLFRRERNLTHLTELGRMMLPLMTQCFESANAARQLAASYKKGTTAPLCFTLSHTVNLQLLIQPLTELVKAFPGLELKFTRGTADEVGEQLRRGDAELGIACPLREPWERLESWVLFTERFELAVPLSHPLAMHNSLQLSQLTDLRLLPRDYCEQAGNLDAILSAQGLRQEFKDHIASDHDLLALLAANVGISFLPRSAMSSDGLRLLQVRDLELSRPVVLYAVSGRQRSPAATGLLRLLRAANWPSTIGDQDATSSRLAAANAAAAILAPAPLPAPSRAKRVSKPAPHR